jgi:Common central domain of tyrosinase/Bacterial Ig domain
MRRQILRSALRGFSLVSFFLAAAIFAAPAQTVYMKDTPADTGAEPNPDNGPMWVSQDIWVRNTPDPGYQPFPFSAGSPPWAFPPHQNPVYRDPMKSTPNYVYVEVRNDSAAASSGTERLRVYWAKASTGLSWPTQWVDYEPGGPHTLLYGAEITKPRINAATATTVEKNAYVQAVLHIANDPAYVFPMGADYWHTQQTIHGTMGSQSNIHETLAFLPWHREFVNRYEIALQQYDPTVKLLYWDWRTNPISPLAFMGNYSGSTIGAPFLPTSGPSIGSPPVARHTSTGTPPAEADSVVLARNPYDPFISQCNFNCPPPPSSSAPFMSSLEDFSHNYSHVYVGGTGGNMSNPSIAAQDPFFFLLHGNVDRLWAQWQRNGSHLARLDPAQVYGASLSSDVNLSLTMSPWDGSLGAANNSASSAQIQPWETSTNSGEYVVAKTPTDPSVVSPPIYDQAPLTIPVLQPGQAVVMQIPWYPPNPNDFASFGADQGHFCLVARIETSNMTPFGMDTPETTDINANTKNNNKIVWKNVEIVDDVSGMMMKKSFILRNVFDKPAVVGLHFAEPRTAEVSFLKQARVFVELPPRLIERWRQGGTAGRMMKAEAATNRVELLSPEASLGNITLAPGEAFSVNVDLELAKDYTPRPDAQIDLIQTGAPGDPEKVVGGQRFTVDLSKLVLVKADSDWRYWDNEGNPGPAWASLDYDDAKWKLGAAPLASAGRPATRLDPRVTTYFRHGFDVADPSFYRNAFLRVMHSDGAAIYLNGKEVYRANLPAAVLGANTMAVRGLAGLEREVFVPVKLDPALLRQGKNVVAAEIHANSPGRPEVRFELELLANYFGTGFPPDIAFAGPREAAVFQAGDTVPVQLEALSGDGKIARVSLYEDGRLIGSAERAPYTFNVPAGSVGAHRLRAVALDDRKQEAVAYRTVTVVEKVPPRVELLEARSLHAAMEGEAITVSAEATPREGKIARVEFWVKDMASFASPSIRVATVSAPPYTASIKDLKPGHYMFWAIAVDDHGGSTQSFPGHIMIDVRR